MIYFILLPESEEFLRNQFRVQAKHSILANWNHRRVSWLFVSRTQQDTVFPPKNALRKMKGQETLVVFIFY